MKRYTTFIACCLVMFISTGSVFAQNNPRQNVPGQQIAPGQQMMPGQQIVPGQQIMPGQQNVPGQQIVPGQLLPGQLVPGQLVPGYGYGLQVVPVVQAWTYGHKMPIVLQGNIVQFYGGRNLYIFRDSSGDILVKIGPKEWQNIWYQGISIAATDNVEIYGEVHWPRHGWGTPEVHARYIRKL